MNLISFAAASPEDLQPIMDPIMTMVGYVIFAIKIIVPIVLIVWGMIAFAQAVISQDEGEITKAQNKLVKKVIAAILVYLVITLVTGLMNLVGVGSQWKEYARCALNPFDNGCDVIPSWNDDLKKPLKSEF